MKYAYKVCHSEAHKSGWKLSTGRALEADEISWEHENLALRLDEHHDADPAFDVTLQVLAPSKRGVIVIVDAGLDIGAADKWLARFLTFMNKVDLNLCLIAQPLPRC